jgi:hypothetical protein
MLRGGPDGVGYVTEANPDGRTYLASVTRQDPRVPIPAVPFSGVQTVLTISSVPSPVVPSIGSAMAVLEVAAPGVAAGPEQVTVA